MTKRQLRKIWNRHKYDVTYYRRATLDRAVKRSNRLQRQLRRLSKSQNNNNQTGEES